MGLCSCYQGSPAFCRLYLSFFDLLPSGNTSELICPVQVDMSEGKSSPEDEAKRNARLKILHAIGSTHALSSPLPTPMQTSILTEGSTTDVLADATMETKVSLPPPPLSPKPRSPRTSPTSRLLCVLFLFIFRYGSLLFYESGWILPPYATLIHMSCLKIVW